MGLLSVAIWLPIVAGALLLALGRDDQAGVVRWAHVEEHPGKRRENAEILAEIAKLG